MLPNVCMERHGVLTHEMLCMIMFVIDTKDHGLKIEPKIEDEMNWNLKIFCVSDWAEDPETRISITGFIAYLLAVTICWRSKAQRSITLSSNEADYISISEAARGIKLIYYLLKDLHVEVILPIFVKIDNDGAIFKSEIASTGVQTKLVDTCYHLIREFIVHGFIEIQSNFYGK
jgi:hypothetical protein